MSTEFMFWFIEFVFTRPELFRFCIWFIFPEADPMKNCCFCYPFYWPPLEFWLWSEGLVCCCICMYLSLFFWFVWVNVWPRFWVFQVDLAPDMLLEAPGACGRRSELLICCDWPLMVYRLLPAWPLMNSPPCPLVLCPLPDILMFGPALDLFFSKRLFGRFTCKFWPPPGPWCPAFVLIFGGDCW